MKKTTIYRINFKHKSDFEFLLSDLKIPKEIWDRIESVELTISGYYTNKYNQKIMSLLTRRDKDEQIAKCKQVLKLNDELIRWIWLNQNEDIRIFDCIKHLDSIDDSYEKIINEFEKI